MWPDSKNEVTYEDLVGQDVHARLFDKDHPEWQRCRVVEICAAGIKLKSCLNNEVFIVGNEDVVDDVRADGAFIPWERDQKQFDGKCDSNFIHTTLGYTRNKQVTCIFLLLVLRYKQVLMQERHSVNLALEFMGKSGCHEAIIYAWNSSTDTGVSRRKFNLFVCQSHHPRKLTRLSGNGCDRNGNATTTTKNYNQPVQSKVYLER